MGCDIHLYIERKVNGVWEPVRIDDRLLPDDRNYRLFGFLANVRGTGGHFEGRGFPDDTSWKDLPDGVENRNWLGDHSFTYATLYELQNAPWEEDEQEEDGFLNCYFCSFIFQVLPRLVCNCGFCDDEEQKNIRILMGFDS